jgi:hypothetical protein
VDPYHWIPDPDPALYFSGFQDANKNNFCLLLTVGFTLVFKDNKFLRSNKTIEIKGFLNFLLLTEGYGPRRPKKLTDPDPEHRFPAENFSFPARVKQSNR